VSPIRRSIALGDLVGLELTHVVRVHRMGEVAVALATLFSALSGFFPALRASRLDPVTALRYE
jgi:ABC-type lipoprotein release transport system permease subunit